MDDAIPYDDESQGETMSADEFAGANTQMAWSVEDYPNYEAPRRHWPFAVFAAATVALGSVIAAAVITHPSHTSAAPVAVTRTSTPTIVSEPPVTVTAPPTTVTSTVQAAPPPPPPPLAPPTLCDSYSRNLLRSQANGGAVTFTRPTLPSGTYWIPQLSSKRPGTFDDGKTYDCAAILSEHNTLRAEYNALLMWSGDWPQIFHSHNDYWVTVAGMIYPTKAGAQGWCNDHGLDSDHCFPTLIPAG